MSSDAMKAVYLSTALFILLLIQPLSAQESPVTLSLDEAIELAGQQNFDIRLAEKDLEIMKARKNQSSALFLPNISFEETAISTNDPLNVFGFKLKQQIVTQADFNPADLNNPDAFENFSTKLTIQQPLINPDKWLERTAANFMLKSTEEALTHQKHYTKFQVKDAFFKLELMSEQVQIREEALNTAKAFEEQAKNFFDQDLINKSEYLAAKTHRLQTESQLTEAQHQYEEASDQLAFLLGFEAGTELQVESSISDFGTDFNAPMVDFNGNSMLRSIEYQRDAASKMTTSSKFAFIPKLNVFGSLEYNDDQLFGFDADNYMIGASLRWELFAGYKNIATIAQRQAEFKKADIAYESASEQFQLQARKAQRTIDQATAQQRFSESSMEQAGEELKVRTDRFNEGLERTSDVLASQTKLSGAKLQHLQILYMRNIGIALLEYLHETDFTN